MLYCYAYLRLSSSYAYYIWAKSPSVMAIPLVTSNIASRVEKTLQKIWKTVCFDTYCLMKSVQK